MAVKNWERDVMWLVLFLKEFYFFFIFAEVHKHLDHKIQDQEKQMKFQISLQKIYTFSKIH